jgi:hypothetical protein
MLCEAGLNGALAFPVNTFGQKSVAESCDDCARASANADERNGAH